MFRASLALLAATLACAPCAAATFLPLGVPGGQLSAMSDDGRSATGSVVGGAIGGFRWREGRPIDLLPGAVSARGMSASGRYIVGSALDAEQREVAAYWDADGTLHRIGGLPGAAARAGVLSQGFAIGNDARITGIANGRDDRSIAFSWTLAEGIRGLPAGASPTPDRSDRLLAGSEGNGAQRIAIIRDADGAVRLDEFLARRGVAVPAGWKLTAATAASTDGCRIGGYGQHGGVIDSFIVDLCAGGAGGIPLPSTAQQRQDSSTRETHP